MTDAEIREAMQRAQSLAAVCADEFQEAAFKVLLQRFLIDGLSPSTTALVPYAGPQNGKVTRSAPSMGLNEFLATKNVKTHVDRIAAIAYFAYAQGDETGITTRDVAQAYSKAREKKPQNIPDVIATCVRKGVLVDAPRKDGMKAWLITQTGERHVEELP
jgi:hypothetical protein